MLKEVSTRPIPIFCEKIGFSLECVYVCIISCIFHYCKDHLEPILLATVEYCKHDDLTRMDSLLGEALERFTSLTLGVRGREGLQ